jgi:prepilin-type N-terminal cleavage/methylation domain-containing protein
MRHRRSHAYTLVEMVVVCAILALLATAVMPNLVAQRRSQALRSTAAAVLRLPTEARNQAAALKVPVALLLDGGDLVLERMATDDATTNTTNPANAMGGPVSRLGVSNATQGEGDVLKRVALGGEVQVESAQAAGEGIDPGAWRWVVYPDGSADEGGLVLQFGSQRRTLYLPPDGPARWIAGDEMPDPTQERWPAGEVEQRVSTG